GAPEERGHAAAVTVGALACFPRAPGLAKVHDAVRLRRKDAGPANFVVAQAAGAEANIADDFGVKPQPRLARQQFVVRINVSEIGPQAGRLAIGCGGDDEPVHVFEAEGRRVQGPKSNVQSPRSKAARRSTLDLGLWTLDFPT